MHSVQNVQFKFSGIYSHSLLLKQKMAWIEFIGKYSFFIGLLLVLGFVIWKFVVEPILHEGEPLEYKEPDYSESEQ